MSEEASPSPNINRSVYGYVLLLLSDLALLLYLFWAFVPDDVLTRIGLRNLPSKYWCLAIPVYVCVAIAVFILFIYPGINLLLTKPFDSSTLFVDKYSKREESAKPTLPHKEISSIYDLPIDEVCRRVYLDEQMLRNL